MATQAQILANQRNAEKSTGPRTTEGKTTVSQNAIKHGLTAQQTVIPGENQADFNFHHDEMLEELNPVGPMESLLAERIISLSWRLQRTVRIQNETIEVLCQPKPPSPLNKFARSFLVGTTEQSNTEQDENTALGRIAINDFSNARVLDRLMMYERRIENSLYKTINELQKLRLIRQIEPPTVSPMIHSAGLRPLSTNDQRLTSAVKMQNKPNLINAQMNTTCLELKSYRDFQTLENHQNKPNLHPTALCRQPFELPHTGPPMEEQAVATPRIYPQLIDAPVTAL